MNGKLNQAHQQERKSQSYLLLGKIDEAVLCHEKAAELLAEVILNTITPKAKESLELQRLYHIRQKDFVRVQHRLSLARKQAKEKEMAEVKTFQDPGLQLSTGEPESVDSHELRSEILRRMAETDSLLAFLSPKNEILQMTKSDTHILRKRSEAVINSAIKNPTNQQLIIEELEMNNRELKKMVTQLCEELEGSERERCELQNTVRKLQKQISEMSKNQRQPINNLFSPNEFSPLCELTPGGGIRELPILAPLELPKFDFDSLKTTTN